MSCSAFHGSYNKFSFARDEVYDGIHYKVFIGASNLAAIVEVGDSKNLMMLLIFHQKSDHEAEVKSLASESLGVWDFNNIKVFDLVKRAAMLNDKELPAEQRNHRLRAIVGVNTVSIEQWNDNAGTLFGMCDISSEDEIGINEMTKPGNKTNGGKNKNTELKKTKANAGKQAAKKKPAAAPNVPKHKPKTNALRKRPASKP